MPRFFAEPAGFPTVLIGDAPSVRHITGPLRRHKGDELAIRIGEQGYRARIMDIRAGRIMLEVIDEETLYDRSGRTVHLGLCLVDPKDFDDVLRPLTELGVADIIPVVSQRSRARPITPARHSRWRSIVLEAVKQCERRTVPVIHEPVRLETLVLRVSRSWSRRLFAHKDGEPVLCAQDERDVGIVIGPEGGFTGEEVLMLEAGGFMAVSMGHTTLRAVTAAITAMGVLGLETRKN